LADYDSEFITAVKKLYITDPMFEYSQIIGFLIFSCCQFWQMGATYNQKEMQFYISSININIKTVLIFTTFSDSVYSKMIFLGLNQVYYLRFKCNTHNNYNQITKTK